MILTMPGTPNKHKLLLLIVISTLLTISVAGTTLLLLYQKAYQRQTLWLQETALHNAFFMQTIGEHEIKTHDNVFSAAFDKTLSQIKSTHEQLVHRSEDTGYILINKPTDKLSLLMYHEPDGTANMETSQLLSVLLEPYQLASTGKTGILRKEIDGEEYLFAYSQVPALRMVLVIKRNLAPFKAPFKQAGLIAAGAGLIFIFVAAFFIYRIGNPLVTSAQINHTQLQTVLNTIVDGVLSCNTKGIITSFNASAENIFGYSENEVLNQSISILIPFDLRKRHDGYMSDHVKQFHRIADINREVMGQRKDGSVFPIDIAISENKLNEEVIFTAIVRDISERKKTEAELHQHRNHLEEQIARRTQDLAQANSQLAQLAREDSLTGIANRRVFDEALEQEMRRARRSKKTLSLMICDIDFFKNYNDSLGHQAGDECLKTVASLINSSFKRAGEVVARYGGEEFGIILPAMQIHAAESVAESLLEQLKQLKIKHPSSKIASLLTMSIGIATHDQEVLQTPALLLQAADKALYQAKANGRDRVEIYQQPHQDQRTPSQAS